MRKELENRLINLSLAINRMCKALDKNFLSQHITTQIIRSSTSSALNYGEAQAAESRKDFIHKIKIVLKELRETLVCLKIIVRSKQLKSTNNIQKLITENNELISIFVKSVSTAQNNLSK